MKGILVTLAMGLVTAIGAQAEGKRYLVKFKSPSTFGAVVQQMRKASPAFFQNPRVTQFQVLGKVTNATEALENLGLLVVETNGDVSDLKNNPAVDYVEPEFFHPLPEPMMAKPALAAPSPLPGELVPTPWGITTVHAPDAWFVTKGENTRVLVLDTGVDAGHPALKDRFVKGQNFSEDRASATDVTDIVGHGTHVSGTILASGDDGGLKGVAPRAQLWMARVCGTDHCSSVAIAEGVNWGINENVQVMSLSISGSFVTPAEAEAFQLAEQANIVVVAASGNEAVEEVGYPAALPSVLAVGAVDSSLTRAEFSNYGPELALVGPGVDVLSSVPRGMGRSSSVTLNGQKLQSVQFEGSPVGARNGIDLVDAGFGSVGEFQAISASGKIALVSRGNNISFHDKAANAIAAHAVAIVIYNNKDGLENGTVVTTEGTEIAIPAVMILQQDGESLRATLAASKSPDLAVAVVPTDYASYQGTSMATPHVAGVAALVRSANPSLSAAQVRALMMDTASPLAPNDQNQYGAGLVDAATAVQKAVHTAPEAVELRNGF